jgi:predicted MFS family arabinose efflux permease
VSRPAQAADDPDHDSPGTARVLAVAALAIFASSLFLRVVDPVIPQIAADLAIDTTTVALLSTAYALPYALVQPILGGIADNFGKGRILKIAMVTTGVAGIVGALAPNFAVLLVSRIVTGIVAGGIFPIALALAGDLVPVHRRQVAFSRLLAAAMLGNLLGSPLGGVIADTVGWRGVFAIMSVFALGGFVAVVLGFRGLAVDRHQRFDFATALAGYGHVLRNPLAKYCFLTVFLEGVFVFGLFPYIAALLAERGEARAVIAGIVLAGFGIGGFLYSGTVSRLLARFGERRLMVAGGVVMAAGLVTVAAALPWQVEFGALAALGFGFYLLHGVVQVHVTELAPASRGLAMSLHSAWFFLGQAVGPVLFGYGLANGTIALVIGSGAVAMIAVAVMCAAMLEHTSRHSGRAG